MLLVSINWIQKKLLIWESVCLFMPKSLAGVHTFVEYDGERKNKMGVWEDCGRSPAGNLFFQVPHVVALEETFISNTEDFPKWCHL